jgi:hypothetical protein
MAKKPKDLLETLTEPEPEPEYTPFDAFAVVRVGALFQPCRLHIAGGQVTLEPLHDAHPYEALAYEFLSGDVLRHYEELQIKRSRPDAH